MKALVKAGSSMRLEEVPDPVPDPGEVLIEVSSVGICGTDIHILHDDYAHADPLIPGHEFTGRVVDPGAGAAGWEPGTRVVAELHTGACGECALCRSGNPQICPSKRAYGTWRDGAFAERIALPAWLLHRVPEGIGDATATLIEPTACAVHGIARLAGSVEGLSVLVTGHGPIGLLAARVCQAGGASKVLVSGRSRRGTARLEAAARLGFETVDSDREDVAERALAATAGAGVDLVVETSGSETALASGIDAARPGAAVVVLGLSPHEQPPFPWNKAVVKDLRFLYSFSSNAPSWERALELAAAGSLDDEAFVTHRLPLERFEDAFASIESGEAVKVVLEN